MTINVGSGSHLNAGQVSAIINDHPCDQSLETASSVESIASTSAVTGRLIDAVNPNRTFTVFAHGTMLGREDSNTTIGEILKHISGEEYEDFIVLDGPAAKPKLPGSYCYNDLNKVFNRKVMLNTFGGSKWFGLSFGIGAYESTARLKDAITGISSKHSAATAVSTIVSLQNRGGIPGKINIIGYSRGAAVTASQIVHQLKSVFNPRLHSDEIDPIKISLFLIDPVAGRKDGEKPVNRLSPNTEVDNVHIDSLIALYSRDDEKPTYKPQYPRDFNISDDVQTAFTILPGRHKTLGRSDTTLSDPSGSSARGSRSNKAKYAPLDDPAKLLTNYALRFLHEHGVDTGDLGALPDGDDLVGYHDTVLADDKYLRIKQSRQPILSKDFFYQKIKSGLKDFKRRSGDDKLLSPREFYNKTVFHRSKTF